MLKKTKKLIRAKIENLIKLQTANEKILDNSFITGKLFPFNTSTTDYLVDYDEISDKGRAGMSIPPKDLWEGYADNEADYLASGEKDMNAMLQILNRENETAESLTKVLDLGCAAGRMLRHYPQVEGKSELWGSDINARYINWCQQHFDQPFHFLTNSTSPHLPFEDNSFDLVYCGSVFTHITDLSDAWLLEIRRILKKGGYAYITIHDQHTLDLLFTKYKDDSLFTDFINAVSQFYNKEAVKSQSYAYFSIFSDPASQVFYNRDFLINKWQKFAEVVSVNPEAHDHQTAVLLRKR